MDPNDPNIQALMNARRMIDAKLAEMMNIPTDPNEQVDSLIGSGAIYPQTEFSMPARMGPGMGAARGPDRPPPMRHRPAGLLV